MINYIFQLFSKNENIESNNNVSEVKDVVKINNKEITDTTENLSLNEFFKSAAYVIQYMIDDNSTTYIDIIS